MGPHEETHCNNLEDHFNGVNEEEDEIDLVGNSRDAGDLLVNSEEKAVCEDHNEDDPVEPGVDGHNLDDPVPKRIGHRKATQRNSGVILLLGVLAASLEVRARIIWESIFD